MHEYTLIIKKIILKIPTSCLYSTPNLPDMRKLMCQYMCSSIFLGSSAIDYLVCSKPSLGLLSVLTHIILIVYLMIFEQLYI